MDKLSLPVFTLKIHLLTTLSKLAALVCVVALCEGCGHRPSDGVVLVREGRAAALIVLDPQADESIKDAVRRFTETVKRSTGATLPVMTPEEETKIDASLARVFVGDSPRAAHEGLDSRSLPPETWRIQAGDSKVFVIGAADGPAFKSNPGVVSRPTLWALNHLLEEQLGVRWLWPGELGTYVPRRRDLVIPRADLTRQPALEFRSLRLLNRPGKPFASADSRLDQKIRREAIEWAENHESGSRSEIVFGHNFGHWWKKYSKDHPDYFAELPAPHQQPFPKPGAVKLRLANPAVIEQIAREYEEAGRPRYWNVSPNDGSGFDISASTRAWDIPADQNIQEILTARANLTARYVRFWNLIYERLRQINPDVVLVTYAYSSYRTAPPAERPLTARAVIQIVDRLDGFENWKGWATYAEGLFLRPNWWHQGADAPYLPLKPAYEFLRFAAEHRMRGLDMDSILGYWATQGPNYYLAARQMSRPDISLETVLAEYTSAFGKAAPKIREYLDYWQKLTLEYNYALNATGSEEPENSRYQALVRAGKVPRSILNGSKYALPYLYSDEVLTPALHMLDEAEALIGESDSEALRRVAFLRKGLDSLKATREQIRLGQKLKLSPSSEALDEFSKASHALESLREQLSSEHVIWAQAAKTYEERYGILLRSSAFERNEINLDGM